MTTIRILRLLEYKGDANAILNDIGDRGVKGQLNVSDLYTIHEAFVGAPLPTAECPEEPQKEPTS